MTQGRRSLHSGLVNPHLANCDSKIWFWSHGWLNNNALESGAQNRCLEVQPRGSQEPTGRPQSRSNLGAASFRWAKTPPATVIVVVVFYSQIFDRQENFSEGWMCLDMNLLIFQENDSKSISCTFPSCAAHPRCCAPAVGMRNFYHFSTEQISSVPSSPSCEPLG